MNVGVVVFPGSNCDHDAFEAVKKIEGGKAFPLWHKDTALPAQLDAIILPGGFSYGDYLRSGAIASLSPIMNEVVAFANKGGKVIGICNGFQILCEARLLPGALLHNASLTFRCKDVLLRVDNNNTAFTSDYNHGQVIRVPIAHGEGNYFADPGTIRRLEEEGRVVFRYCNAAGEATEEANPNGAINNIAGIINQGGNVLGMMPHPERVVDPVLGGTDGLGVFTSLAASLQALSH